MGMSAVTFGDMTPREFANAVNGYAEDLDQASRERWEQSRLIAYYAVAPHMKKGKTMQATIPLPWDSRNTNEDGNYLEPPTEAQLMELMRKMDRNITTWQTLSALS